MEVVNKLGDYVFHSGESIFFLEIDQGLSVSLLGLRTGGQAFLIVVIGSHFTAENAENAEFFKFIYEQIPMKMRGRIPLLRLSGPLQEKQKRTIFSYPPLSPNRCKTSWKKGGQAFLIVQEYIPFVMPDPVSGIQCYFSGFRLSPE